MNIRLTPIGEIRPSSYNPRETDPARLEIIALSLRKLGFLLPIYADADGEILSGHQRHLVASHLGLKKIPVAFCPPMDLAQRKALNIVFNRATNDLSANDTPKSLTSAMEALDLTGMAKVIPDKRPDSDEFYPCMSAQKMPIKPLLAANSGRWIGYAANISRTLRQKGIVMPIVVDSDLNVVNGIGRLEMLASKREKFADAVKISRAEAKLATACLNLLSMDFDLHRRYADLLRYNSFRRARRVREGLGRGFVFAVIGNRAANTFDLSRGSDLRRWIAVHGRSILDFGAGHLQETNMLRLAGLDVTPFEPYRLGVDGQIDKAQSMALTREFLKQVAHGRRWSSIFIASVLNSVPFAQDRRHIVAITASLATCETRLYAVASSVEQAVWESVVGKDYQNETHRKNISFVLPYESGVHIGELASAPKVQKHHTRGEFRELFAERFASVKISHASNNVQAVCSSPKSIDKSAIRKAIEFEFNLPYPDGSRMGLVKDALAAFGKRLKVKL